MHLIVIIIMMKREGTVFFLIFFPKKPGCSLDKYQNHECFCSTTRNQADSRGNGGELKFKPLTKILFFFWQANSTYFENLNISLLGSCTGMLHFTSILNILFCIVSFDVNILLLFFKNSEGTWAKSITLICGCYENWLELNSFFTNFLLQYFVCIVWMLKMILKIFYPQWTSKKYDIIASTPQ